MSHSRIIASVSRIAAGRKIDRIEGISDALGELRAHGAVLYVATSKPRVYAERIVTHFGLGEYFAAVFGAELDGTRADKRELLHYAKHMTGTATMP